MVEDEWRRAGDRSVRPRCRGRRRPRLERGHRRDVGAQSTCSATRHSRRCLSVARGPAARPLAAVFARSASRRARHRRRRAGTADRGTASVRRPADGGGASPVPRCRHRTRRIASRNDAERSSDAARKRKNPGDDLFSRKAALSVSSALESLTSVFGMGTGMASPLESPGFVASGRVGSGSRAVLEGPRGRRKDLRSRVSQSWIRSRFPATDPWSVAEEVKPSTVSTAQLHPSPDFHMRPIKQVVSLRSYPVDPVGNLISRRASHLDAFSAYPDRT